MDDATVRAVALLAASLACPPGIAAEPDGLLGYAEQLVPWILAATTRLTLTAEIDGDPVPLLILGGSMPQTVNATVDNNTVTLTAATEDDHGNPTGDQLAWSNDDTDNVVAAWSTSPDFQSYTGALNHVEGTVNISVTDPSAPDVGTTDVQVVVGPGATASIQVSATVT